MKFVNKYMKWVSTAFILSGIVLTSINFYPLNIFVHGAGSLGWTIVGYAVSYTHLTLPTILRV